MSYKMGEGVLDNTYSKENVVSGIKSNIRFFIDAIIVGVIGIVIGTLSCLGSCFGCGACVETAACVDSCMMNTSCGYSCGYEDLAWEMYSAGPCSDCNGDDYYDDDYDDDYGDDYDDTGCGGETSEEDYDDTGCSSCAGEDITITVIYGDEEEDFTVNEDATYFPALYPANKTSEYYRFLGLFDAPNGGTQYVDDAGTVLEGFEDGMVLYAQYEEYGYGEEYTISFDLAEFVGAGGFEAAPAHPAILVTVGGAFVVEEWPNVPHKEGYDFAGWYVNNRYAITGDVQEGMVFHLSDFGVSPTSSERNITISARYVVQRHTVLFNLEGSKFTIEVEHGATYGSVFSQFEERFSFAIFDRDTFFGWATTEGAGPESKISNDATILEDVTVFAIIRPAVYYDFHYNYNHDGMGGSIHINFPVGTQNVSLEAEERLADFRLETAYPGYRFLGWYTTAVPVAGEQPVQTIARVEETSGDVAGNFYARWEIAHYTIEYMLKGTQTHFDTTGYTMADTQDGTPVELWTDVNRQVGYDFAGWCENEDCTDVPKFELSNTYGTKVLYAKLIPHEYTITLRAMQGAFSDGSRQSKGETLYGDNYTLPVPSRTGYTFLGWYYGNADTPETAIRITDGEGNSLAPFTYAALGLQETYAQEDIFAEANRSLSVFAYYEINKYTITLEAPTNHRVTGVQGEQLTWQAYDYRSDVEHNTPFGSLNITSPTKEGHAFAGWLDANGNPFNGDTLITSDLTLRADFAINKFTITVKAHNSYDTFRGPENQEEYEVKQVKWFDSFADVLVRVDRTNPTLLTEGTEDYRRVGWFADQNYTQPVSADADVNPYNFTGAMTVYAKYEYSESYVFHKKIGSPITMKFFDGDTVGFPTAPEMNVDGYTFKGWCADEECLGTVYGAFTEATNTTQKVTILRDMPHEFWAKYEINTYTVKYYLSPEDARANVQFDRTYEFTVEESLSLLPLGTNGLEKTGYTFAGWKALSSNNTVTGSVLTSISRGSIGDKRLCATWTANPYTITLQGGSSVGNSTTVTYDALGNLGVASTTKEGYDFVGWSWKEPIYPDKENPSNIIGADIVTDELGNLKEVYQIARDTTAYPVFKLKQHTVVWYDSVDNRVLDTTTVEHFKMPRSWNAEKVGYTFDVSEGTGWYKDRNCTDPYYFDEETTADLNLYAKFTINQYDVTLVVENAIAWTGKVDFNTSLSTILPNGNDAIQNCIDQYAYKFRYWYGNPNDKLSSVYTESDRVPADALTLYAEFDKPTRVHFYKEDGETLLVTNVYYGVPENNGNGSNVIQEYVYTRKGYTNLTWYNMANNRAVSFDSSFVARGDGAEYHLRANWTSQTYTIYYSIYDKDGNYLRTETGTYRMSDTETIEGVELLDPPAQSVGYDFSDWYYNDSFSGTPLQYLSNYGVSELQRVNGEHYGDIYLYGKWEAKTFSIKFYNGNTCFATVECRYLEALPNLSSILSMPAPAPGRIYECMVIRGSNTVVVDGNMQWYDVGNVYDWTTDIEVEIWWMLA